MPKRKLLFMILRASLLSAVMVLAALWWMERVQILKIASTQFPGQWNEVHVGMDRPAVHALLGAPDVDVHENKYDVWIKENANGRWELWVTYCSEPHIASIATIRYYLGQAGHDKVFELWSSSLLPDSERIYVSAEMLVP